VFEWSRIIIITTTTATTTIIIIISIPSHGSSAERLRTAFL